MQKSPNFLKHQSNPQGQSLNQSSNLAHIAYYQAGFWLMLLSTFVASLAFWVLAEISLSNWQLYGFVFSGSVFAHHQLWPIDRCRFTRLLIAITDGAIFLLILTILFIFKLVYFAQTKIRQRFLVDHPLGHHLLVGVFSFDSSN